MAISRKVFSTEMCFQSELNFSTLYRGDKVEMEQLHKQNIFYSICSSHFLMQLCSNNI